VLSAQVRQAVRCGSH